MKKLFNQWRFLNVFKHIKQSSWYDKVILSGNMFKVKKITNCTHLALITATAIDIHSCHGHEILYNLQIALH